MDSLTEEEKKALRGSKFAPLPSAPAPRAEIKPRLAHPGGPMKTNKAAALAKFLERKLHDPIASLDPKLVELAVNNAKETVRRSGASSTSGRVVHHVKDFGDSLSAGEEDIEDPCTSKKHKKKKKKKKEKNQNKKIQKSENSVGNALKRPKKKLKL